MTRELALVVLEEVVAGAEAAAAAAAAAAVMVAEGAGVSNISSRFPSQMGSM